MTDYVWVVELTIKDGQLDNFKTLMNDMTASIKTDEPNTLNYELFISDDETVAHIYEQYADGAAFQAHVDNFNANFAERFGAAVDVTRFIVYGNPDSATTEILNTFGATIMKPLVGVSR